MSTLTTWKCAIVGCGKLKQVCNDVKKWVENKKNAHYEKTFVLQLDLQLGFSCNFELQYNIFLSLSAIGQVAKVEMAQFTISKIIYICNACNYVAIQSLQILCHYVVIIMQLNKEQSHDMAIMC
jgi:hypothetical protein